MPLENTLADVSITFGITMLPHLRDFVVQGPLDVTGVSDTPSRLKVFTCRPTNAAEEESCAAEIVNKLATQAFRGAPTAADLQDAMKFYEQGRKKGGFEPGIRMAVQAILMSPRFLFRFEEQPAGDSRRDLSHRGRRPGLAPVVLPVGHRARCGTAAGRLARARCAPPPASRSRCAGCWPTSARKRCRRGSARSGCACRTSTRSSRTTCCIRSTTTRWPRAMKKETELFFDSIVREDRKVLDLLTADYSFVNERLANHYGIPNVMGSAFQRVTLPPYRRGLLGQGSILTLTSVADRTSPVQRGKWVMEVLLASPPPPPPPNVPTLDDRSRRPKAAACCRRASAWKSTARTRPAPRATR